jgi:molecular chaperone DnaK
MKGEDKQEIEDKTKALAEASSSLAQRLYAEQQENASAEHGNPESQPADDSAVDADFEEVKEEAKEQEK